jgi:protease I
MAGELKGKTIAILATEGVEQVELTKPRKALDQAGATTELIAPKSGRIQAMKHIDKGDTFPVDRTIDQADPERYDGLMLPGGALNPDNLRQDRRAVEFVRTFFETGKPIAAICHAPWMLVEAGIVKDLTITSWPSLRTDVMNAGGTWVDKQVITDQGVVTSRKPDDIPAFNPKMIEEFQEGRHPRSTVSMAGQSTAG